MKELVLNDIIPFLKIHQLIFYDIQWYLSLKTEYDDET